MYLPTCHCLQSAGYTLVDTRSAQLSDVASATQTRTLAWHAFHHCMPSRSTPSGTVRPGLLSWFRFMLHFGDCIPHLCVINHVVHDVDLLHDLKIVLVHAGDHYLLRNPVIHSPPAVGGLPLRVAPMPLWLADFLHGLVRLIVRNKFHGIAHALMQKVYHRTRLPANTADNP